MFNFMKYRPFFYLFSGTLILISAFSIIKWGFRPSIDFAGGTVWQVAFSRNIDQKDVSKIFTDNNLSLDSSNVFGKTYTLKFKNITTDDKTKLEASLKKFDDKAVEQSFETLGPSLGKELLTKTVIGIILSAICLLIFISTRFNDYSFGIGAIVSMLHDGFILIGAFSLLGHFFGAELDALFVTALLTTLSASVHDTVVTFDRMRELRRKDFRLDWVTLANKAVSEVIVRSLNTSMTVFLMLLALVVLGGASTHWFAMALLIGVVCGTYSSTAIAIPFVLLWKDLKAKKTK
jgi:preprotein translocase subunit SecF